MKKALNLSIETRVIKKSKKFCIDRNTTLSILVQDLLEKKVEGYYEKNKVIV